MDKKELFEQASKDYASTKLISPESVGYISRGVKISHLKFSDEYLLENVCMGTDHYSLLTEVQEALFEDGWVIGTLRLCMENNMVRINAINDTIKNEVNGSINPKTLKYLKSRRENLLKYYMKCKEKLRTLTN